MAARANVLIDASDVFKPIANAEIPYVLSSMRTHGVRAVVSFSPVKNPPTQGSFSTSYGVVRFRFSPLRGTPRYLIDVEGEGFKFHMQAFPTSGTAIVLCSHLDAKSMYNLIQAVIWRLFGDRKPRIARRQSVEVYFSAGPWVFKRADILESLGILVPLEARGFLERLYIVRAFVREGPVYVLIKLYQGLSSEAIKVEAVYLKQAEVCLESGGKVRFVNPDLNPKRIHGLLKHILLALFFAPLTRIVYMLARNGEVKFSIRDAMRLVKFLANRGGFAMREELERAGLLDVAKELKKLGLLSSNGHFYALVPRGEKAEILSFLARGIPVQFVLKPAWRWDSRWVDPEVQEWFMREVLASIWRWAVFGVENGARKLIYQAGILPWEAREILRRAGEMAPYSKQFPEDSPNVEVVERNTNKDVPQLSTGLPSSSLLTGEALNGQKSPEALSDGAEAYEFLSRLSRALDEFEKKGYAVFEFKGNRYVLLPSSKCDDRMSKLFNARVLCVNSLNKGEVPKFRVELAIDLLRKNAVSVSLAAKIAGMSLTDFLLVLRKLGIKPYVADSKDIDVAMNL